MSHAERHPGINQRIAAPERTVPAARIPEGTGGTGSTSGNFTQGSPNPRDPNFFQKHWKKLAGGAAVLLASGGVVYGVATGIKGEAPAQPGPIAEEPADPFAPEQPETGPDDGPTSMAELIPTVEELRIPAGLEGEQLGTVILDRFTAWENAGATDELRDLRRAANESWDDFLPKLAESNRDTFATAILGEGWQDDAELTDIANSFMEANLSILQWYVTTAWSGEEEPANIEGYRMWRTINSVEQVDQTLTIDYNILDNADKNTAPERTRTGGVYSIVIESTESGTIVSGLNVLR